MTIRINSSNLAQVNTSLPLPAQTIADRFSCSGKRHGEGKVSCLIIDTMTRPGLELETVLTAKCRNALTTGSVHLPARAESPSASDRKRDPFSSLTGYLLIFSGQFKFSLPYMSLF